MKTQPPPGAGLAPPSNANSQPLGNPLLQSSSNGTPSKDDEVADTKHVAPASPGPSTSTSTSSSAKPEVIVISDDDEPVTQPPAHSSPKQSPIKGNPSVEPPTNGSPNHRPSFNNAPSDISSDEKPALDQPTTKSPMEPPPAEDPLAMESPMEHLPAVESPVEPPTAEDPPAVVSPVEGPPAEGELDAGNTEDDDSDDDGHESSDDLRDCIENLPGAETAEEIPVDPRLKVYLSEVGRLDILKSDSVKALRSALGRIFHNKLSQIPGSTSATYVCDERHAALFEASEVKMLEINNRIAAFTPQIPSDQTMGTHKRPPTSVFQQEGNDTFRMQSGLFSSMSATPPQRRYHNISCEATRLHKPFRRNWPASIKNVYGVKLRAACAGTNAHLMFVHLYVWFCTRA